MLKNNIKNYANLNKKVICLNNGRVFNDIPSAAKYLGVGSCDGLHDCCVKSKSFFRKMNGVKLIWMFFDEYESFDSSDLPCFEKIQSHDIIIDSSSRRKHHKIICLNNGMIFNTYSEARDYVGLSSCSGIRACCSGRVKCAGKINGVKIRWMILDDYKKLLLSRKYVPIIGHKNCI